MIDKDTITPMVYKHYYDKLKESIHDRDDNIKISRVKKDLLKDHLSRCLLSSQDTGYSFMDISYVLDNIIGLEESSSKTDCITLYDLVSHELRGIIGPYNNSNNKPFWDITLDNDISSRLILFCANNTLFLVVIVTTGDDLIDSYILDSIYNRAYIESM